MTNRPSATSWQTLPQADPDATAITASARFGFIAMTFLLAFSACGDPDVETQATPDPEPGTLADAPDVVVARLGDKTISAAQLLNFSRKLPETLQSGRSGIDRMRNHLQTLIDREMLWIEADRRGMEQSRNFQFRMKKVTTKRLIAIYQSREIVLQIEPGEFEAFVEEHEFNRAIRFSEIIVDSEERALELRQQIVAGENFEGIARKWSVNNNTAPSGGDRGRYSTKLEVDLAFRGALFSLGVGELSEPIAVAGGLWAIVTITDEMIVTPGPEVLNEIGGELHRLKFDQARRELGAKLAKEFNLDLSEEGVSAYLKKVASGKSLSAGEEDSIVLFTFGNNGKINAGDLIELLRAQKFPLNYLTTEEEVVAFAARQLIPDAMIFEAAVRARIHKEPPVAAWLQKQRQWYLIVELRASVLERKLDVSEDEARQYFDANSAMFADPDLLELEEILVATREEAERLKGQIENGASLAELAGTHSTRSLDHRDDAGRVRFYGFEKAVWGGLVAAAKGAQTGVLSGPVEVEDGYSVFRVLARGRKPVTFEKVKLRVIATVKWLRKQVLFEQLVDELRPQYASMVEIDEKVLESVLDQE